ncbi:MAG: DUF4404 family protein [Burkholderiaceae bacterium]
MSNAKIKSLLAQLHDEINKTVPNDETRELARQFDAEIHQMLDKSDATVSAESLIDRAQDLENRFATDHPVAGQAIREVIQILNRIGI